MPETPLPQTLFDAPEDLGEAPDTRPRRRTASSSRPVSAFAPAHPRTDGGHGALTAEDATFVSALHDAGLAVELDGPELARSARSIEHEQPPARRIDLLDAYYHAAGDALRGQGRRATDRWFVYRADEGLSANQLVQRLLNVIPELAGARVERVGGDDGALLLRAGDDLCALDEEREDATGLVTVSVRELVRACNVLLDRHKVRVRLVGLVGDGTREAYVGISSISAAMALVEADYLAPADVETLMHLAAW